MDTNYYMTLTELTIFIYIFNFKFLFTEIGPFNQNKNLNTDHSNFEL